MIKAHEINGYVYIEGHILESDVVVRKEISHFERTKFSPGGWRSTAYVNLILFLSDEALAEYRKTYDARGVTFDSPVHRVEKVFTVRYNGMRKDESRAEAAAEGNARIEAYVAGPEFQEDIRIATSQFIERTNAALDRINDDEIRKLYTAYSNGVYLDLQIVALEKQIDDLEAQIRTVRDQINERKKAELRTTFATEPDFPEEVRNIMLSRVDSVGIVHTGFRR
jgi:hypothetical protein